MNMIEKIGREVARLGFGIACLGIGYLLIDAAFNF